MGDFCRVKGDARSGSIKLLFAGDVQPNYLSGTTAIQITEELEALILKHDGFCANLECAMGASRDKISKLGASFQAKPDFMDSLVGIGITHLCLAINHAGDFGPIGINETVRACNTAGVCPVGFVTEGFDGSVCIIENEYVSIAILNVCDEEFGCDFKDSSVKLNFYEELQIYKKIKEIAERVDHVVVVYHGGLEYHSMPLPEYQSRFRLLIEYGVSCVICHHTHCISGVENYNGGVIFYGLGNFFSTTADFQRKDMFELGMLASVEFRREKIEYKAIVSRSDSQETVGVNDAKGSKDLLANLDVSQNAVRAYWDDFLTAARVSQTEKYLFTVDWKGRTFKRFLRKLGFYSKRLPFNRRMGLLNVLRNHAHRSILARLLR